MYAPHTVSLITLHGEERFLTVLRGVMLQGSGGRSILRDGAADEPRFILFIPSDADARNAAGEPVSFLLPCEFLASAEPEAHWTLFTEGESAARASFFVKGVLTAPLSPGEARETSDFVFPVAAWALHDYGSPGMRHITVYSRPGSRYYRRE